ncbi:TIGR04283 family arsenosugar biosynthesis glycosyltransferase [Prosthecobacter sp.]|uniref:TIGR04283 family arsenosugar biosynthesis glycosyltransferase n=1 Tax=Prosthecobacter sp. TaxID=1965333 RepID=UPI0024881765|nr:TIGR04283 family arsenosugar biosynthesis glycosyltransferase [Prosthecobacter sp.]MDI1313820.1 TIGR04283 family arsenosugar biosynthesis glycosyltransferase [Prosthecobacter sp.]
MLRERLILFTRFPIAGKAKTRLIPALGAEGAAETQRQMTELALCRAVSLFIARGVRIEVRYEGGDEEAMRDWLGPKPCYRPQGEGDLGQRIDRATNEAFTEGCDSLVIIGADCPRLDETVLSQAFDALRENEVIFGPAQDGGYYLVGLRRPVPALFQDIEWSTAHVLSDSIEKARASGSQPELLVTLPDVDEPHDLDDWHALQTQVERVSVIIPTVNEAAHLAETLRHVAAAQPHEIIIADGGSTDETLVIATAAGAQIVCSGRGRGLQMNNGAQHATGGLLFFLHADTLPPTNYTQAIRESMRSSKNMAGAFRFALREPRPAGAALIERFTACRNHHHQLPYGDQGLFVRRAHFAALGRYPEWPILEDVDFICRARLHGRIVIHPAAAETSGRRWQQAGVIRTMLRHQLILIGYHAGLSPQRLAGWR